MDFSQEAILDSFNNHIAVLDENGNIVFTNIAWKAFSSLNNGNSAKTDLHVNYLEVCRRSMLNNEPLAGDVYAGLLQVLKGDSEEFSLVYPCHSPREERWFTINVNKIKGNKKGVIVSHTNVTVQIKKEQKFSRYQYLLDQIPYLIWESDQNGKITFFNESWLTYTGIASKLLLEKNWIEIIHPEELQNFMNSFNYHILNKLPFKIELKLKNKDNHFQWFLMQGSPKYSDNNELSGFTGVCIDITERKILEKELLDSKNKAEAGYKAKTSFLSLMSHEIRTPLNAVIGITNLLVNDNSSKSIKSRLDSLKFATDHLMMLINDVLDLQKIEEGKLSLEKTPFNLVDLVKNIKKMNEFRSNEKGIVLQAVIDGDVPQIVVGDPIRIAQILNNLISNSIKFTNQGNINIILQVMEKTSDYIDIMFSIKDTGIGIPEDKVDSIFERFTQAEANTARRFGGSGLGLSIVKSLLELMGGCIEVESKYGEGSNFYFNIKFLQADKGIKISDNSFNAIKSNSLQGIKILIAEDYEINRIVACEFLKKWGAEFDEVSNGREAIDKCLNKKYDLILMDIQMPEKNGLEAAEEIRSIPINRDTPIIALSAESTSEVLSEIKRSGMQDFILKPFDPVFLYNKITDFIKK